MMLEHHDFVNYQYEQPSVYDQILNVVPPNRYLYNYNLQED